jgi:cell fate regulator YaaT (PSP1 superfamily)
MSDDRPTGPTTPDSGGPDGPAGPGGAHRRRRRRRHRGEGRGPGAPERGTEIAGAAEGGAPGSPEGGAPREPRRPPEGGGGPRPEGQRRRQRHRDRDRERGPREREAAAGGQRPAERPRPPRPERPPRAPEALAPAPGEGAGPLLAAAVEPRPAPRRGREEPAWEAPAEAEPPEPADEAEVGPAADEAEGEAPPVNLREEPAEPRDPDGDDVFAALEETPPPSGQLCNTVGVKFREAGKIHEFDAGDLSLGRGDRVVVDTDKGLSIGLVAVPTARRLVGEVPRRVIRKADQNDVRQEQRNQRRELEALKYAAERVRERKLPMKLFRVEYLHGGNKATFFFSAEGRVDFRDLVKDLTNRLHTRVELRQVGVRDEARIIGGIGTCGRELCCSTWLPRFEPVSIRMAKDQNLVLNPQKVSGVCGRLKCCLVYEESTYRELRKGLPKPGKRVQTPRGEGKVQEVDVLGRRVKVWFEGGPPQTFAAEEVQPVLPPGAAPAPGRPAERPDRGPRAPRAPEAAAAAEPPEVADPGVDEGDGAADGPESPDGTEGELPSG